MSARMGPDKRCSEHVVFLDSFLRAENHAEGRVNVEYSRVPSVQSVTKWILSRGRLSARTI